MLNRIVIHLRIFIIDREKSILDSLKLSLEEEGHEVFTASDPSACPVYHGHHCDKTAPCGHALFISYHFRGMNGLDFLEMMRQRGCKGMMRNKILMSGNLDLVDMEKAKILGCTVLQKPVSLQTINKIVQEIQESIPANEKLIAI